MAWQNPSADWDVCWDFTKYGKKKQQWGGAGGSSYGGAPTKGKGGGKEGKGRGRGAAWSHAGDQAMPPWVSQPWYGDQAQYGYEAWAGMQAFGGEMNYYAGSMPGSQLPPFLETKHQEWAMRKGIDPDLINKEYEGSLKSLSERHGYGFIACEETHRIFGRDVYLGKELVPEDLKVLDRLKFKVALSAKGHPQAQEVSKAL